MIKKITIENFKKFEKASYDVNPAGISLFVGPNNGGKTTALQAISMWSFVIQKWNETKGKATKSKAQKRSGASVVRNEIYAVPVQEMKSLWFNTTTQDAKQKPIKIHIIVEGTNKKDEHWEYGVELYYGGPELIYCKPLDLTKEIPDDAFNIYHLPPLSGVQTQEPKFEEGKRRHIIGEGRPGEVLRNLLLEVKEKGRWDELCKQVQEIFYVNLEPITFFPRTHESILIYYRPQTGGRGKSRCELEIASGGSGFLQFLLLSAFLYVHENSILLIDEPDSHMHVRLQQGMYDWLQKIASLNRVQLLISTHSEVLINGTDIDKIYTFFGNAPQKIKGKRDELVDALKEISSIDILNAQEKTFILFTEGLSDLSILKSWANKSRHNINEYLTDVFFGTTGDDQFDNARDKFKYLRIIEPQLKGFFVRDNVRKTSSDQVPPDLEVKYWQRKEIENYLIIPSVLERFVGQQTVLTDGELFVDDKKIKARKYLKDNLPPKVHKDPLNNDIDGKGSDFLEKFFTEMGINISKRDYWKIAEVMVKDEIHPDIKQMLDDIWAVIKTIK